ncbi:unnamed protein product, partial [Schistocephalus solidus]
MLKMVFESLVADLLNRFLGNYLEKLNASQLSLGLLSGNVVLENVAVRTTAFDDFSLPVRVLQGHIGRLNNLLYLSGRLTLKIPFKNLYTEPVIAELDGLHILAVPNSVPDDVPDSFLEKLAAQIIKNVQVKVENIHIRYEDKVSVPGLEFSAGLTLKKLAFQLYEDELDILNLTLARQKAEVKSAKRKAEEAKKSGGWFSGWFSRGSDSSQIEQTGGASGEGGQIIQRVQMEMTAEEKAKLYSAIDYSEDTSRTNFPVDYISAIINFSLHGLSVTLNNTELSDPRIIRFQLEGLTAKILQRSGDHAFDFSLRLGTLEALGARKADTGALPVLISSDSSVSVSGSRDGLQASLLTVEYSKNPLDRKADERIRVVADPLELIYDADTINRIVDFFKSPADLRLEEISSSVLPSIDEVKAMTTTGLRYMASQRTYTDVVIDVRPSCFILPELGVYKEKCRLILVDLGSVSLQSAPAELALPRSDEQDDSQGQPSTLSGRAQSDERYKQLLQVDYEQLKEQAYDRFEVELSSMQIILVQ